MVVFGLVPLKIATSDVPGAPFGLQFVVPVHNALEVPVHVKLSANAGCAGASKSRRKDARAANEVRIKVQEERMLVFMNGCGFLGLVFLIFAKI